MRSKIGCIILFLLFVSTSKAQKFYAIMPNSAWELGAWTQMNFVYQSAHGQVYSAKKMPGAKRLSAARILPYYRGKIEIIPFDIYSFRGDCNRLLPGDTLRIQVSFSGKGHRHNPLIWDTVLVWKGVQVAAVVRKEGRNAPGDNPLQRVLIYASDSARLFSIEGQRSFAPLHFQGDGNSQVTTPDKLVIPQSYYDSLWPWNMSYRNGEVLYADTVVVNYAYSLEFNGRGLDGLWGSSGSDGSQGGTGEVGGGGEGGGGGWHGADGKQIEVFVSKLPHRELYKIKIIAPDKVSLYYINLRDSQSKVVLDVSGGNGGDGGDGGDGGAGGSGDSQHNIAQGMPGPAGGGGDGGNGGNGGSAIVYLDAESAVFRNKFILINLGGSGGSGGDGGSGAPDGDDGVPGDSGQNGAALQFLEWEP